MQFKARLRAVCAAVAVAVTAWASHGRASPQNVTPPPLPAGAAAVSGTVIDAQTKQPVAGAVVRLSAAGYSAGQLTDRQGRFVFRDLSRASYILRAAKLGYLDLTEYGLGPVYFSLSDDEWKGDFVVPLNRPASISGTLLDERGEPVAGAYVRAMALSTVAGAQQLLGGPVTSTDDRGAYRFWGLREGAYVVMFPSVQVSLSAGPAGAEQSWIDFARYTPATPEADGRTRAYGPTFYPGVRRWTDAERIEVGFGQSRTGVDLRLRPTATWAVTGTVQGPPGATVGNLPLRLMPAGSETLGPGGEGATAISTPSGQFTFLNVPEGDYTIVVTPTVEELNLGFQIQQQPGGVPPRLPWTEGTGLRNGGSGVAASRRDAATSTWGLGTRRQVGSHWARTGIVVQNSDLQGISLQLQPTVSISGRFVFEEGALQALGDPRAVPANGDISLGVPSYQSPTPFPSSPDFKIDGLMSGEYFLRLSSASSRRSIRSITHHGVEYLDRPFDTSKGADLSDVVITVTGAVPKVVGVVRAERGVPAGNTAVVYFPIDERLRNFGLVPIRLGSVPTSSNGAYALNAPGHLGHALPAGDYYVVAVPIADESRWQDADFLARAVPHATRVTLEWGRTTTRDLVVTSIP